MTTLPHEDGQSGAQDVTRRRRRRPTIRMLAEAYTNRRRIDEGWAAPPTRKSFDQRLYQDAVLITLSRSVNDDNSS